MDLRQKAAKGIFWSAAQTWGARFISFLVMLALARLVQPEAFGLVAYASVFMALVGIFVDQGFNDAIVQCDHLEHEHLDTAFWICMLTGTLLTGFTISASGIIANLFHEPQLASIISWLSLSFILIALSGVQMAILRRKLDFKSLALRSLVATCSGGLVAVVMAFLGFGVWSLVAKTLLGSLVSAIVLWQVSDWRPRFRVSWRHFKELFSYGISIVGGNFVDFFSLHGDDFLIGYFLGPVTLGYYTLAYNLLIVTTDFLVSVPNAVIFPTFSRLQSQHERLKQSFYEVTELLSIFTFPVFLGMSVLAYEIVITLYGKTWIPSIPVFAILMLIGIIRSASYFYSSLIKASGKPAWRLGIWSLTALLNVIGFLLVVRRGIVAVAAVYVFVGYLVLPVYFLIIRKLVHVSIRIHLQRYIPALFSSLTMITFVLLLKYFLAGKLGPTGSLFVYILGGAIAYLLMLKFTRPRLLNQVLEFAHLAAPMIIPKKA